MSLLVDQRRTHIRATLAAAGAVVLWAAAFVVIRHLGEDMSAGAVSLGRLLVGSLLLGAYAYTQRRQPLERRDWLPLLGLGGLWFGGYNLALNAAEQRIDAGSTAILVNLTPLLTVLLAGLVLGEGFPLRVLIGTVVAFGGVVVIGGAAAGSRAELWGIALCVVAAVGNAVAVILQKPLLGRLPAAQVTWLACSAGAVCCLPFAPDLVSEATRVSGWTLAWVVFLGAAPTALGHIAWAYALARASASRLSTMNYLAAPLAVGLAWLFLSETPSTAALIGGIPCLIGVAVASRRPPDVAGR